MELKKNIFKNLDVYVTPGFPKKMSAHSVQPFGQL